MNLNRVKVFILAYNKINIFFAAKKLTPPSGI
jgi:hypothetical protein